MLPVPTEENGNHLRTCCGTISDKRLLVFISSLSITLFLLSFCFFMLATRNDCASQYTYVGLITLLLGWWMKSPIS